MNRIIEVHKRLLKDFMEDVWLNIGCLLFAILFACWVLDL